MSDEFKNLGNAFFLHKQYKEAIEMFTKGIEVDPKNHVLFSNRSAAHAMTGWNSKALEDANQCILLNPHFVKGYSRKGCALLKLGHFTAAIESYEKGLALDTSNQACRDGLRDAGIALQKMEKSSPKPADDPQAKEYMNKLLSNPETADLLKDPEIIQILQDITSNPSNLANYMTNPKVKDIMTAMMGMQQPPAEGEQPTEEGEKPTEEAEKPVEKPAEESEQPKAD